MRKYLLLVLFAFVTTIAFAQNNFQDVVYLKNGNIIRGVIIEQIPNKSLKIETADKSVFVYQFDEVEKFTKEPIKGGNSGDLSGLKPGNKKIVEMSYQLGVGNFGRDRIKLDFIYGRQINPTFSIGIGTGICYDDVKSALIPVFADFRTNFLNKKVSPYFSLGLGYSFDASNNLKGVGLLVNPTMGVCFKLSAKTALNMGIGYEMQSEAAYNNHFDGYNFSYYYTTENSGAITINLGFSF